MNGTLRVLRAEAYRALHSRAVRITGLCLGLVSFLRVVGGWVGARADAAERARAALAGGRDVPDLELAGNAFGPLVDGWSAGLVLGGLLLLVHAARTLAGDREHGILRIALTRSASRPALVVGRALLAVPAVLLLVLVTGAGALAGSWLLYEFGPLVEDGYEIMAADELWRELASAVVASIPPLLGLYAFGLLVSSVSRSASIAVATALALFLGFDLFKEVLGQEQYWVFAAYAPSLVDQSAMQEMKGLARGFSDAGYSPELLRMNLVIPWPQMLLLVLVSSLALRRKPL